MLGWPKSCELAHAFMWEYSYILYRVYKAEVGPTSGPTWRLSHLECDLSIPRGRYPSVKNEGHDLHLVDLRLFLLLTILRVHPHTLRDV